MRSFATTRGALDLESPFGKRIARIERARAGGPLELGEEEG